MLVIIATIKWVPLHLASCLLNPAGLVCANTDVEIFILFSLIIFTEHILPPGFGV